MKQNKSVICCAAVILLVFTHGGLHLSGVERKRGREKTRHKDNDVGVKRDVN